MSSSMYLRRFKFLDQTRLALFNDRRERASSAKLLFLERRSLIALMSGIKATVPRVRRGHGGTAEKNTSIQPKNLSNTTARCALFV
jgi:hypothetical protein